MKQSIILSCIIIFIIVGALIGYSVYTENIQMHKNYTQAKDAFRNGRLKEAAKLLEGNPPRDIFKDFYLLKLNVELNQHELSQAERTGLTILDKYPQDAYINYLMSLIYYNLGDNENTEKYLKAAVQFSPENIDYKYALATYYSNIYRHDEALKLYKELLNTFPDYQMIWLSVVAIYENKNDINSAINYCLKAMEKFNKSPYFAYKLADLYAKLGNKDLAARYFAKTVELDVNGVTVAKTRYFEITGKPYHAAAQFKTEKIPYVAKNGLININASFNGVNGRFIIDTGASDSAIYVNFLKKNNLKLTTNLFGIAQSANGQTSVLPIVNGTFKLGNSEFKNVKTFVMPNENMPFDGIIGNNLIQNTDYFVDRQNNTIIIKSAQ